MTVARERPSILPQSQVTISITMIFLACLLLLLVELINCSTAKTNVEWSVQRPKNQFNELKCLTVAEFRIGDKRTELLTSVNWSVILGWEAWTESLREKAVVPNGNCVVKRRLAVDETFNRIAAVVQNKPI